MNAAEVIEEIKRLTKEDRLKVVNYVIEQEDSWIPDAFKEAMAEAEAGNIKRVNDASFGEEFNGPKV